MVMERAASKMGKGDTEEGGFSSLRAKPLALDESPDLFAELTAYATEIYTYIHAFHHTDSVGRGLWSSARTL
jgi:hypothetical protein